MTRTKVLHLLVIFALLVSILPAATATAKAETSSPVISQTTVPETNLPSFTHLLELPIPTVPLPPSVNPAQVTGYYQRALESQWTRVEAKLNALQKKGLIESFQLLPKANAFLINAQPDALEQLKGVGKLTSVDAEKAPSVTLREAANFQARLQAATQAAQEKVPEMDQALAPKESPAIPAPVEYLVSLDPGSVQAGGSDPFLTVGSRLSMLKDDGNVVDIEWLSEAYAFRVSARSDLSNLLQSPGIKSIVLYSQSAVLVANRDNQKAMIENLTAEQASSLEPLEISAFTPTTPTIQASLFSNYLFARSSSDATTVFTLTTSTGELKNDPSYTTFYGWNWSGSDYYADVLLYRIDLTSVRMEPGDILTVDQDGQSPFSIEMPDLSANVDRDTDTVSGIAPANISSTDPANPPTLQIQAWGVNHDGGYYDYMGKYITTDSAGSYSTDFTYTSPEPGTLDLRADTYGWLTYMNNQGNQVLAYYHAPQLYANIGSSSIYGDVERMSTVTVTLETSEGTVKGEYIQKATDGSFYGYFKDIYGNNVKAQAGDVVRLVSDGGTTITLPIVAMTALADPVSNTVAGSAPPDITSTSPITLPNLTVDVYYGSQIVTTTASGEYLADQLGNFSPGESGSTRYADMNGDVVQLNFYAPIIYVRGSNYDYTGQNYISGYAASSNSLVTITLKRGGSSVATAVSLSDGYGRFSVNMQDVYGNPVNIQGGDQVEVTCAGITSTANVPNFEVTSDPDADELSGSTDATVVTTTVGLTQTLALWPMVTYNWGYGKHVLPTSGSFTAVNPFYWYADPVYGDSILDWNAGAQGHLRYIDAQGFYIYDDFRAPYPTPVLNLRGESGYSGENYVSGTIPSFCGYGNLTLKDNSGTVKSEVTNVYACPSFNRYLYDKYGNPANILAGDTLEASFGTQFTEVEVPDFTITSDPDADTITGYTDATVVSDVYNEDGTLTVWPNTVYDQMDSPSNPLKSVIPDIDGDFTAANPFEFYDFGTSSWVPTTLDIFPGDSGHIRYIDANGNRVYTYFQAPPVVSSTQPVIYVRGYSSWWGSQYNADNYVSGYVPGFCGYGTVRLKDDAGALKDENTSVYACNTLGTSFISLDGTPINIEAGDFVEATFGEQTTVVEVPAFDVTSDASTDQLTGTTNAEVLTTTFGMTQTLAVWPMSTSDGGAGKYVQPDTSGAFTATNPFYGNADSSSYPQNLDWNSGAMGHLRYVNADGNQVYAGFTAFYEEPVLWVHKDSNSLWGYTTGASQNVEVSLESGGEVKTSASAISNQNGQFEISFYDTNGNPVMIEEGDDVVLQASTPVSVHIPQLNGQTDIIAETISGEGPANTQLNVETCNWWWGCSRQGVITDDSGAFEASFLGTRDIQPGDQIEVDYRSAEGHTIFIQLYAGPKLYAELNAASAWGYAPQANIPVTVTLKSGATVKASDVTWAWDDNSFSTFLTNTSGQEVPIAAGDSLEVDFGDGNLASMTVTEMSAQVDAEDNTLSGTGPVSTPLGVEVNDFSKTVTTNTSGEWNADPGAEGVNIYPGDQALVRHVNVDFNETWLYATAPVAYVRAWGTSVGDYESENFISGYAPSQAVFDISLKRGDATVATQQVHPDWGGYYFAYLEDALGLEADILGGDQIVISDGTTQTINVPDIQAVVNADSDTVSGSGPANAELGIYVNGSGQTVRTDASGIFTATFSNINPGNSAYFRYVDPDGNWIHAIFWATQTGTPYLSARWSSYWSDWYWDWFEGVCPNCVSGQAGEMYANVYLSLERGADVLATTAVTADDTGEFSAEFRDTSGTPVNIEAGDVIEMTTGGSTFSMTVADLTAQANKDSNLLYGTGPAGKNLYYYRRYPWGSSTSGTDMIGPDGNYYIPIQLENEASGYVRYTDESGNRTYLSWAVPYVAVRENGNEVYGTLDRGIPVTARLLTSNGKERAVASTTSSIEDGRFWLEFTNTGGEPLIIQPDDTVEVNSETTTTLPVVPLNASVDTTTEQVNGTGPTNTALGVEIRTLGGWYWRDVTTDASGTFTADFSDETDIQAGAPLRVYAWNEDSNLVYIAFNAPMVRVNPANDIVDGYATPNATASLVLKRGASTIATATGETDMNGFFSAYFTDASDELVDILAGDTVEVTASPTNTINVASITANIDTATSQVTGTAPANAILLVKAFSWMDDYYTSSSKTAYTDGSGKFTVDFSDALTLADTSYVYVRYTDAQGNQTSFVTTPAWSPLLDFAKQEVQSRGVPVVASAFGAGSGGDLTPPLILSSVGDTLVFSAIGGSLVVTHPDGTVEDSDNTMMVVQNAPRGIWKVQVRLWGGLDNEGQYYALAAGIGKTGHDIFLPMVINQ